MSDNTTKKSTLREEIRKFKLENLIKEAVTLALFEQQPAPQSPAPAPAAPPPPVTGQNMAPSQPPQAPEEQMPPAGTSPPGTELTLDNMIERLNIIRGGKSFTDPEIYGQLTSYFKTLSPETKQTIDQFLQSVSKIMVNVRSGVTDDSAMGQETVPTMTTPTPGAGVQPPISASPQGQPAISPGGPGVAGMA